MNFDLDSLTRRDLGHPLIDVAIDDGFFESLAGRPIPRSSEAILYPSQESLFLTPVLFPTSVRNAGKSCLGPEANISYASQRRHLQGLHSSLWAVVAAAASIVEKVHNKNRSGRWAHVDS
jgi:hypothetical protein